MNITRALFLFLNFCDLEAPPQVVMTLQPGSHVPVSLSFCLFLSEELSLQLRASRTSVLVTSPDCADRALKAERMVGGIKVGSSFICLEMLQLKRFLQN